MIYLENGIVGWLRRIDAALGIHIVVDERYPGENGIFRHHNISACALNARDEIVFFRCHGFSHTVWAGGTGKRSLIHKFLHGNGIYFSEIIPYFSLRVNNIAKIAKIMLRQEKFVLHGACFFQIFRIVPTYIDIYITDMKKRGFTNATNCGRIYTEVMLLYNIRQKSTA